jgi:hypothetical protein
VFSASLTSEKGKVPVNFNTSPLMCPTTSILAIYAPIIYTARA